MTAAERKKIVATVHARVVQLLTPYGIAVEHVEGTGYNVAEFTFRVPDLPPDKGTPGMYSELVFHLSTDEVRQCHADPKQLDCLPLAWARILTDWVPNLFEAAPLPAAAEVDWRPGEYIPEDFGAA